MKPLLLLWCAALFLLSLAGAAVTVPDGVASVDDLPPEVREKLPEGFALEDIPKNLSDEDLRALAVEHNVSFNELAATNASSEKLRSLCRLFLSRFDFTGKEIPSFVPFSYEVFNLFTFANQSVASVEIADRKIVGVNCSRHRNATYEVFFKDLDVLTRITTADYVLDAYRYEKKQGNIKLVGVRFGQMVKVALLHAAVGLMSVFG